MGGELSEEAELVVQRHELLAHLLDGERTTRDVRDDLDLSRSTVSRALRELSAAGLVERNAEGYRATPKAALLVGEYDAFRERTDAVARGAEVLEPLSPTVEVPTELLVDADTALADDSFPRGPLEAVYGAVADADRYRALLPRLADSRHVGLWYEHVVTDGDPAKLVVSPDLFGTLRSDFGRRLAAMADAEGFTLRVGEVPAFTLVLADGVVSLVAFTDDGAVNGVVRNDAAAAREWAEQLFEECRADAEDRTAELRQDGGQERPSGGPERPNGGTLARPLPTPLAVQGFVRLSPSYFARSPAAAPAVAWRTGLDLVDVHTGYAVDRTREVDGERRSLSADLRERLRDGDAVALLGPPGCGKSTVCKQVACEWYADDVGAVFYRRGGRGRAFEDADALVDAVEAARGHSLVVVEDAVRPGARAVFDAVDRLADRDDAAVLLDARHGEWEDPPSGALAEDRDAVRRTAVDTVTMPPLLDRDCEALLERVERTADGTVDLPVDALRDAVRQETTPTDAQPGDVLLLLHRAADHVDPLDGGEPTSLEADARDALTDLREAGDAALDVGVLANLCNAAGFDVTPGLVGTLAVEHDPGAVRDALDRLEGRLLFEPSDPDANGYRAIHASWSTAFLAALAEDERGDGDGSDDRATRTDREPPADRFGRVATALLALADEPDRRERAEAVAERTTDADATPALDAVADDPGAWADTAVERLFTLGQRYPKLAPLFGESDTSPLELPDAADDDLALRSLQWRGRANALAGNYEVAERAYDRLRERTPDPSADAASDLCVRALLGLADVADETGASDRLFELAEDALAAARNLDDEALRAEALRYLGRAERWTGDTDAATERFETGLAAARAAGDRLSEIDCLLELGHTATVRNDHDAAIEYKERGLELARELGAKEKENRAAGDLGMDYYDVGPIEEAERWFRRSLELAREIGDRSAEAAEINNLGMVELRRGRFEAARERFEAALEREREIGQPGLAPLKNLAMVHYRLENYDEAVARAEEGLERSDEAGWDRGKQSALLTLANVARDRGNLADAETYAREARELSREVGAEVAEATSTSLLGAIRCEQGDHEAADELLSSARSMAEEAESDTALGWVHFERARLCRALDDPAAARDHYRDAVERFRAAGDERTALEAVDELVDVCEALGDHAAAVEWCDDAVDVATERGFDDERSRFDDRRAELREAA